MKQSINLTQTILIIDRDEEDCQFFQEAITLVSPSVELVFWNGKDPLFELVEKIRPSMIFIEYKLPGDNGIELVQQLKCHPVSKMIPVVMWSTGCERSIVNAAYKAGVQSYQEKPWELSVWADKVNMIVQQCSRLDGAVRQPARNFFTAVLERAGLRRRNSEFLAVQTA